ncbi:MAG: Crp/Fnr family transcriptional regulator [Proteobacteria bacterium]|nr:Crp/Fnr family transcriptional regulator [Pseudomonadota bacterium]
MPHPQDLLENQLLAALNEADCERLFPRLVRIDLELGDVLYESGEELREVYFPIDSVVSLLYVMESGASAEISIIGNDGMVGIGLFMGGNTMMGRAVVQAGGSAYRLNGEVLKDEFHRNGRMQDLLLNYTQALLTQMAQTAVCNRHHSIDQQLCRWLLLTLDRLPSSKIEMTHELISNMLGVRREGVTEAAHKLQSLGAITYKRGHIDVLDRAKLEALSCECYSVVRKETERLKGLRNP